MTSPHPAPDPRWRRRAACGPSVAGTFRPTAAPGPDYLAQVAAAKAVCASCPVRLDCLTDAMTTALVGIAGGLTASERGTGYARALLTDAGHRAPNAGPAGAAGPAGGTVYLLHFARPYRHARHYCGWTADLPARLHAHAHGRGARLITVITTAGIGYQLARTWPGPRARERQRKNQGGLSRCCPLCGVTPRTGDTTPTPLTAAPTMALIADGAR